MKFSTLVNITSKIFKAAEKLKIRKALDFDSYLQEYLDENIDILSKLQAYSGTKAAISATSGKKTMLNFFNQILESDNKEYVTNLGNNAKTLPFYTSLIIDLNKGGKKHIYCEKDYCSAAFDIDEIKNYFLNVKFDYLLLSNLFASQLDNLDLIEKKNKIQEAIVLNPRLNLIINADDPMFFQIDSIKNDSLLTRKRKKFLYGFEEIEFADEKQGLNQKNDILICSKCGCKLDWLKIFYSHLGHYDCECGFKRPKPDLSAHAKIYSDYTLLTTFYNGNKNVYKVPIGGVYNAYNALGAIALSHCLNIERKTISDAFDTYTHIRARDEIVTYKAKKIKIKVITNPTSLTEALREAASQKVRLVFCLNDEKEDGLDTSWIFDSNPKCLKWYENKIYITGQRCDDAALWLKYGGINSCLIVMDSSIKTAIKCCYYEIEEDEKMLILTSPSLVDEIYRIIGKN